MMQNKILELVNRDGRLLVLFSGMLIVGILLIAVIIYISTSFI